jgi:haloalkane dehalogenase
VLPASILRKLEVDEMEAYVEPFKNPGEDRRPTLTWPREIPLENEPKNVCDIVKNYGVFLSQSNIPKLFIDADPGMILNGPPGDYARTWPNQQEVKVKGLHFIQEDSPLEISDAIEKWIHSEGI